MVATLTHKPSPANSMTSNIGPTLASKLSSPNANFKNFSPDSTPNSFLLSPTNVTEITLTVSLSEGYDEMCIIPTRESIDLLASPLSHLCNLSFSSGVFPNALKIAKVLLVLKSGDNSNFFDYRPVSILPCLSKVFGKLFHSRYTCFLTRWTSLTTINMAFNSATQPILWLY